MSRPPGLSCPMTLSKDLMVTDVIIKPNDRCQFCIEVRKKLNRKLDGMEELL